MEKDQKILIGIITFIFVIVCGIGIYLFIDKTEETKISDAEKFKIEYEAFNNETYLDKEKYLKIIISKDNKYVYKKASEIVEILKSGTGVIYFGFANCPWCRSMVNILNDAAAEYGIEKIYYLDIKDIRDSYEVLQAKANLTKQGTEEYQKIVKILAEYLTDYSITDEAGNNYATGVKRLYAPTVVTIRNGKVVGFHEGTIDSQEKYQALTEKEEKELQNIYEQMISKTVENMCSESTC